MLSLVLFVALCIGGMTPTEALSHTFTTHYDKPFTIACSGGYVIHHIISVHSNWYEDRKWTITCGREPKLPRFRDQKHSWTGYINHYDGSFTYECPGRSILTGIKAKHHNWYEDRKFAFRCTTIPNYVKLGRCKWTGYVNTYDHRMDYHPDYYLKGVSSIHHNHYEDRIFKFFACEKPGYHYHDATQDKKIENIKSDAQVADEIENIDTKANDADEIESFVTETDVADEMDKFDAKADVADEMEAFETKSDVADEMESSGMRMDVADEMESSDMRMDAADKMENLETKPDFAEDMERSRNKKRASLFKKYE